MTHYNQVRGIVQAMAHSVRIGAKGRIVLPAALRAETHLKEGDELIVTAADGRVVMETPDAIKARLRAAAAVARTDGKVVDRLLAHRRADLDLESRRVKRAGKRTSSR
jgi:AbrB family looped-hinge helix DNA binding protein